MLEDAVDPAQKARLREDRRVGVDPVGGSAVEAKRVRPEQVARHDPRDQARRGFLVRLNDDFDGENLSTAGAQMQQENRRIAQAGGLSCTSSRTITSC